MNTELKNLINTAFDAEKLAVDAVNKSYFKLIGDALAMVSDAPGDVAGFSGLQAEALALSNPTNLADLTSFIETKFSTIPALSGVKVQAVIAAIMNLIPAVVALEQAFVS